MLYVPGAAEDKLEKIGRLPVTSYIIDLEDAVAPAAKARAATLAGRTVEVKGRGASLWVRVNPFDSGLLTGDLSAVVRRGLAGIVLPKAESGEVVRAVDALIAALEREHGLRSGSVRLMPTIETAAGVASVDEVAASSSRVLCLGFGAGDLSLDLGIDWPPPSGELSATLISAKVAVVLASRGAGLGPPHDGVFPDFRDLDRLRAEAQQALELGFSGKHAIHPAQIPVIEEVFAPSAAQISDARSVLAAYDLGLQKGVGGVHIDGRFVDAPVAERARRVLANWKGSSPSALDGSPAQGHLDGTPPTALRGVRVVDISSLYAAPLISTNLADFGASVTKVEHPRGDDARRWGLSKDGVPLWWKTLARNKRLVALDLNDVEDREVLLRLIADADVLIENFRPGRLEQWGLAPPDLQATNPGLIVVRMTGFGQYGPYSSRPGFGTLAEAASGFAHMTGQADGPPTLPPFGLADGVAGLVGTYAVMMALYWRDAGGGEGQVIDLSLYEPLFSILGPQITEFTQLGVVQGRTGNRSPRTSPRNAYRTADDRWVAISGGTQQIAGRIFAAIDRADMAEDPRYASAAARLANAEEIEEAVTTWIAARTLEVVLERFAECEAPIAPIYDSAQIFEDPHFRAREAFVTCPDADLGSVVVPGIVPRLSRTPGRINWTGATKVGADTAEVLREVGATPRDMVGSEPAVSSVGDHASD
jgi:formyl-CoA transferase